MRYLTTIRSGLSQSPTLLVVSGGILISYCTHLVTLALLDTIVDLADFLAETPLVLTGVQHYWFCYVVLFGVFLLWMCCLATALLISGFRVSGVLRLGGFALWVFVSFSLCLSSILESTRGPEEFEDLVGLSAPSALALLDSTGVDLQIMPRFAEIVVEFVGFWGALVLFGGIVSWRGRFYRGLGSALLLVFGLWYDLVLIWLGVFVPTWLFAEMVLVLHYVSACTARFDKNNKKLFFS